MYGIINIGHIEKLSYTTGFTEKHCKHVGASFYWITRMDFNLWLWVLLFYISLQGFCSVCQRKVKPGQQVSATGQEGPCETTASWKVTTNHSMNMH